LGEGIDRIPGVERVNPLTGRTPQEDRAHKMIEQLRALQTPPIAEVPHTRPAPLIPIGTEAAFKKAALLISFGLLERGQALTAEQAEQIIRKRLVEAAQEAQQEPGSGVTFELLSGDLTVDKSIQWGGIKLTGGKVNLYELAKKLAELGMLCAVLGVVESALDHTAAKPEEGATGVPPTA